MTRDEKLTALGYASYEEYLRSAHWLSLRARYHKKMPPPEICNRCKVLFWACKLVYGQQNNLHHKTYDRLGHEDLSDLELLCRRCHEMEHFGKSDLPQIVLRACHFCTRPRVTLDPDVAVESFTFQRDQDFELAANILQRMYSKAPQLGLYRKAKLYEVMNHPSCQAKAIA